MKIGTLIGMAALLTAAPAAAQDLYVRVVDVGNGLCVIARAPEGHILLYDAGFSGDYCGDAVRELGGTRPIDMVVFSHSDSDHISDGAAILGAQGARLILHPGDARTGDQLDALRGRIAELERGGTRVIDLGRDPLAFGTAFPLGSASVRFVAGWSDGAATAAPGDPALPPSDRRNALSLVVRLEFGGRSVLLTGDTIGRRRTDGGGACRNAERIMSMGTVPIDSDVLIGQHHGGNNSTSNCFIRAVTPGWVIFSAGRGHGHPTQAVADRLVANHVPADNILRTDRADGEGEGQWVYGSVAGCVDRAGDDDVEILLYRDGREPVVRYRGPERRCPSRGPGGSLPSGSTRRER
jgi:beta-lactamase superfamily II metal-dependent hydrolase